MTIRRWIAEPRQAGAADSLVLILKKSQGSVWSEVGRTRLCPTLEWLREKHGEGEYELRLQQGPRVLCNSKARVERAPASAEPDPPPSGVYPGSPVPQAGVRRADPSPADPSPAGPFAGSRPAPPGSTFSRSLPQRPEGDRRGGGAQEKLAFW